MKTISSTVSDTMNDWIMAEAKRCRMSKSKVVRRLLERSCDERRGLSIHDVMKDVCGIIKGGPRDYASNKKYMKGFGRS